MKRILLTTVIFFYFSNFSISQDCNLSIECGDVIADWGLANDVTFVCEGESFEVLVNPGTTMSDIDEIVWHWGDGQSDTVANFANQSHTYIIDDGTACDGGSQELFLIAMEIFRFCTDGSSCHFQSAPVAVRFKPRAFFDYEPIICIGNSAEFENTSCNGDTFIWDFGDGNTSTDENPIHDYATIGNYQVTLMTSNGCGDAEITQQIQVINPAESNPTPLPGFVNENSIPYVVCMDSYPGSVTVPLDGDSLSLNENYYEWQSLSGIDAMYVTDPPNQGSTPNIPDVDVVFSDTGMFQIILEVDNECGQPNFDTLFFHVLTGEGLNGANQSDACLELIYTPSNFNPNASYTINGNIVTTFPVTLDTGSYTVVCELTNECGTQTRVDDFIVFPQEDVTIFSPSDTTICIGADSLQIFYGPFGGTWTGDHLKFYGDSVFFCPTDTGTFVLTYSKGIDECADSESITITVEDSGITTFDFEVCSDSPPFSMGATPSDGTYTCTACPLCIQGDTFIISEMVALGLTSVDVNYAVASTSGCAGNNTFTVTIDDPNAMFILDSVFCEGDFINPDISNTNGTLSWMVDGQNVPPPPFTTLGGGNHTIKLTAAAGDCEDVFSQEIFITAPPMDVSFTATPTEGCADLEVTLTNTTSSFDNESYEWFINDSLFSTAIQPGTITLGQGFSDTTYVISLSAGNSCAGQIFEETITVFPRPVPRFGTQQNEYCSGDTVCFYNVSFGSPITSWLWDYGNGVTSTDSLPLKMIYFTDTIPTTYTISLTATNQCGTETLTQNLVVNPTDVKANFNTNPVEGCVGVPICFTNFSTLGANVLWDFGDNNTSTNFNICHTYVQAGTYTITLKAFGCGFDSTQFTIIIHPMPTASFSNNTITCPNQPLSFTNNSLLAQNFLWNFGDGDTSTLNNPTHIYSTSGNYSVQLIATSTEGCVDSTTSMVTVLVPPSANFMISTDSICVNDNITFTNSTNPPPLTCYWIFGDGNFSNDCSPTHSFSSAGNFLVQLIVTDNEGCPDTTSQVVNVAPVPQPAFDFSLTQNCSPAIVAFINQTTLGESYLWEFGDGNTSTETTPSHTYLSGGEYPVQLTAINGVCSETITEIVSINQTPNAEIITPLGQTGCADYTAQFTANPAGNNYKYKWDFGDSTFSFAADPTHLYNLPDTYLVTLMVEDSLNGFCADTTTTFIEVFEPVAGTIATTDNLCFGDTEGEIILTLTSGTSDFEYDWSNGADTSVISNLPAGDFTFTVTDDNGCLWSETVNIAQPDQPLFLNIVEEKIVTCYGGMDGALTIAVQGGTPDYTYLWESGSTSASIENVAAGNYNITITDANNCVLEEILTVQQNDSISYQAEVNNISCFGFGDGQITLDNLSGGVAPYFIQMDTLEGTSFNNLEMGNYTLTIMDAEGCTQSLNINILEPPPIFIDLDSNLVRMWLGEEFTIESNHNVANPIFEWTPADGLDCPDCEEPTARPFNDVTYVVVLTDENACTATDTIAFEITKVRKVAIPTAFTPNNDGQNDVFTIRGENAGVERIESLQIFDRWGGMVYQAEDFQLNDFEKGWDGKLRGKNAQVGVYVYKLKIEYVDGEHLLWNGQIQLIR